MNRACVFPDTDPPTPQPSQTSHPTDLLDEMEWSYLHLFCRQQYMCGRVTEIKFSLKDQSQSESLLLQYYAAMAGSTIHAFEDSDLNYAYEARKLAGELFDVVDIETATGLHLLSYHMLAHDLEKSEHYRDMASSMCQRIWQRGGLDRATQIRLSRLELINAGIRPLYQPLGCLAEYERLSSLAHYANLKGLKDTQDLHQFMFGFRSIIQEEKGNLSCVSFRLVSPSEYHNLSRAFEQTVCSLAFKMVSPALRDLVDGALKLVKTVLLYASGQVQESMALLQKAIAALEANKHLWSQTSSHLANLLHMGFLVAFFERDHALASILNGFQNAVLPFFPATAEECLRDKSLLSLISCSDSTPSSEDSPSSLSPTIESWLLEAGLDPFQGSTWRPQKSVWEEENGALPPPLVQPNALSDSDSWFSF